MASMCRARPSRSSKRQANDRNFALAFCDSTRRMDTLCMDAKADEMPLSDRFWTWFEANKKPALIGLAIVILGVLIAVVISWRRSENDTASSEAVANITADQAAFGAAASTNAATEYLKIANEYPKTAAGARALLLAAGSFFGEGKYDQAI